MEQKRTENRNIALFTSKESIYVAIIPVLWGTIMQQFLLYRDVSATLVGIYTTLVSAVQMVAISAASKPIRSRIRKAMTAPLWLCSTRLTRLPIS